MLGRRFDYVDIIIASRYTRHEEDVSRGTSHDLGTSNQNNGLEGHNVGAEITNKGLSMLNKIHPSTQQ